MTLNVRSALRAGRGILPRFAPLDGQPAEPELASAAAVADIDEKSELDFVSLLNRALPDDIQVLAWAPCEPDVDARFSCTFRQYKYFFFADGMDVARMQRAARALCALF